MANYSNVDPDEIEKFSALADEWWNPKGKFKPLHDINPLRLQYLTKSEGSLSHKYVLDVGCGGGILSESLAKQGANVIGIDAAERSIAVAKKHAAKNHLPIDYQTTSIETFSHSHANTFDVITCMEMLEHVPDPLSIIKACQRMLKLGGSLYLSTINRNFKAKMLLIIGAEYITGLIPKGTHDFDKFITPSELMEWVDTAGLTTKDLIGMEYKFFHNQFILSKNIDVNYILHAKK